MVKKKSTSNKTKGNKKTIKIKKVNKHTDVLSSIASIGVVVILLLSLFNLKNINTATPKEVLGASDSYAEEIVFWQSLLAKNPTYLDGWIELSKLELDKGNIETAKFYYDKSKIVNPNSDKLTELEILINSKEIAPNQVQP